MEKNKIPEFSLFGGPLHWLGARLGLVREETNTVRLGIVLGFLSWIILVGFALIHGVGSKIFSLSLIGAHIRLLVAIPLFFICEAWVAPRMQEFVKNAVHSGLVPEDELPILASDIKRIGRIKDSWLAEAVILLLVFAAPIIELFAKVPSRTGSWASILDQSGGMLTLANVWYLAFCLPLFRFLMLRWFWHMGLWWYFLRCVERLKLNLIPTHSDAAAGLGYLEVVHEHFIPLSLAFSAVLSASFAEDIFSGMMPFEALYSLVLLVLFLTVVIFIGPLFIFSRKLWNCRAEGLNKYMVMASHYVSDFDYKWVQGKESLSESQLGTADMQSLADLTNSVRVVRDMRLAPISRRVIMELSGCVILPLLPLVFMKYHFDQISVRLFQILIGQ